MSHRLAVALLCLFLLLSNFTAAGSAASRLTSHARVQASSAAPPAAQADEAVKRIIDEGMNRSQLMDTLTYLTEVIGPRLTNSPNYRRAAGWTRDKLASWGLANAHLEPWGPFGRGWSLKRFSAQVVEPQTIPLIAYPKAWSPGITGELDADVIYLDASSEADLQKYKGKIQDSIVLTRPIRSAESGFQPLATRWTDEEMLKFATDQPFPPDNGNIVTPPTPEQIAAAQFGTRRLQFLTEEGAALLIDPSYIANSGTVAVSSVSVAAPSGAPRGGRARPWDATPPKIVPQIVVAAEDYNRIARMIQQGEKVKMAVNLAVEFQGDDLMSTHTIAEIPGSDLKDEVVLIGAHLDSWHAGTGATDNGAGVAVMMETMRILQALKLQPRRTIRIALWGGEEEAGGSRYYVEQHYAHRSSASGGGPASSEQPRGLVTTPEYDKFSAYFNLDAGTGKIRGVFLAGNEALRPILQPWLRPFKEMGAATMTINGDWGSDFVWFDQAGLPIVSFIQDEIDYETRTHHTNLDVLDHVQPDDLKQAAVIVASFVYQTAMRDERLPRKPVR